MFQIDYDKIAKFQTDCVKGGAAKLSGAAVFYLGFNPLDKKTFTKVIRAYRNEVMPQELKSRFVEFLKIIDFKNTTLAGKRRFALEPLTKAHKPTDTDEIQKRTLLNLASPYLLIFTRNIIRGSSCKNS